MHFFKSAHYRRFVLVSLLCLAGCATVSAPVQRTPLPAASVPGATSAEKIPDEKRVDATTQDDRVPSTVAPETVDPCQEIRPCGTPKEHAEYLRACPSTPTRRDHLAAMAQLIGQQKDPYAGYKDFTMEFEDGLPFVPITYRLALSGPEGMRVHDCLDLLKTGTDTNTILTKIRSQNCRYQDFTLEEIDTLKQMGMPSELIAEMIESTITAQHRDEGLQRDKARQANQGYGVPVSEGTYGGGAVRERQTAETAPVGGGTTGPNLDNVVVNCAAQTAALQACDQLSGILQSICKATAKTQFPCQ